MHSTYRKLLNMIYAMLASLFLAQVLSACNNDAGAVSPSSTTKLLVINTSPDVGPIAAFSNNSQIGRGSEVSVSQRTFFRYTTTPAYYGIGTGNLVLQLRTPILNTVISSDTVTTLPNKTYTLFLVGLNSVDSLSSILLKDTTALPARGNGKIRFINASPRTPALDVYVNGTLGFSKVRYKSVSGYIEVPAGLYSFQLTANGAPGNILTQIDKTNILDGKVYNLYSKGLAGRTDTAAINLNIINNK